MQRFRVPQRVNQLSLFHPIPATPPWARFPPEARQKTLRLLAWLLRQHRRRHLAGALTAEVRDE